MQNCTLIFYISKMCTLPNESKFDFIHYHTFVIQAEKRDNLKSFL